MKVHIVQHAAGEGPGTIGDFLATRGTQVTTTHVYEPGARLPVSRDFDWLVVLGGPMSLHDEAALPWLAPEKRLVSQAIADGRVVLGICLGAQVVAGALGARVFRAREPEIGWFPVERVDEGAAAQVARLFSRHLETFHWHGETFDLPPGARRLAKSGGCETQAFAVGERVLGLQFHPEATPEIVRAMIEHGRDQLVPGRFVQSESEIVAPDDRFEPGNRFLSGLLEHLAGAAPVGARRALRQATEADSEEDA